MPSRVDPLPEPWLENYIVREGDTFVDVGACEGGWTKALYGHFKRIVAIEPFATDANLHVKPDVRVIEKAAWNRNGHEAFRYKPGASYRALSADEPGVRVLPTETLDSMLSTEEGSIDLLKIDVEGGEIEVICGGIQTIKKHRPRIVLEYHGSEQKREALKLLTPLYSVIQPVTAPGWEGEAHHFGHLVFRGLADGRT